MTASFPAPADSPLSVVAVVGSTHRPSKTAVLVGEILEELAGILPIEPHVVRLEEVGPYLAGALHRSQLPAVVKAELARIEGADLLVVATPVYRASFTGLFKHLFDLIDQYALVGTPVLLAATGGSERHGLVIEHQLRPLFAFFQALTLPVGVYAHDGDFTDYRISSPLLAQRIATAVRSGLPLIHAGLREGRRPGQVRAGEAGRASVPPSTSVPVVL
jgi:FMN reductase